MKLLSFDDFPKDITDSLRRANAWQKYDDLTDTLYITSRNKEEPLTNVEKFRIYKYLIERKHSYHKVIIIPDDGKSTVDALRQMVIYERTLAEEREKQLQLYRERAEAIGVTFEQLEHMSITHGASIESCLCVLEAFLVPETKSSSLADFVEIFEDKDEEELDAATIRKQLKYEKNPMRIKQLNKMLSGMRKNRKKGKED